MKFKWLILIIIILTLCFVACDRLFDDDYVWDDWAVALFQN